MEYKRLPDINGWAALRAVVEQGGVNPASRSLSVGQPAITKRIRALEYCYGVALFVNAFPVTFVVVILFWWHLVVAMRCLGVLFWCFFFRWCEKHTKTKKTDVPTKSL